MRHIHTHRPAFTLVEALVSVLVCTIIAGAVMVLLNTVIRGTSTGSATSQSRQRSEIVSEKVSSLLRPASMILQSSDESVIVWTGDIDGSGGIGRHEIRMITWDAENGTIISYDHPDDSSENMSDYTPAQAVLAAGLLPSRSIATGIVSCSFTSIEHGRAVQVRFTSHHGSNPETNSILVRLRGMEDAP